MYRRLRDSVLVLILLVGLIVTLPLQLPITLLGRALDRRRKQRAALTFQCVVCGQFLGDGAIDKADRAWANELRELRRLHPDDKFFRSIQIVHAICTGCGTRYRLAEKERTFARLPAAEDKGSFLIIN